MKSKTKSIRDISNMQRSIIPFNLKVVQYRLKTGRLNRKIYRGGRYADSHVIQAYVSEANRITKKMTDLENEVAFLTAKIEFKNRTDGT